MPARAIGLVVMPDHVRPLVQLLGDARGLCPNLKAGPPDAGDPETLVAV